jgi:hypothetical protein
MTNSTILPEPFFFPFKITDFVASRVFLKVLKLKLNKTIKTIQNISINAFPSHH